MAQKDSWRVELIAACCAAVMPYHAFRVRSSTPLIISIMNKPRRSLELTRLFQKLWSFSVKLSPPYSIDKII